MKKTFNDYLVLESFDKFCEADLLSMLTLVKGKIVKLLNEETEITTDKMYDYLKFVAIFEQFFRFLTVKKIKPTSITGLNHIISNVELDKSNEITLHRKIESIIQSFDRSSTRNFKRITEQRFKEFVLMVQNKTNEDLTIIKNAIDFTIGAIKSYQLDLTKEH